MNSNHREIIAELPGKPGVYQFLDEQEGSYI